MIFTTPYEEPGFVEYKRAFIVAGEIRGEVPEGASLEISLYNSRGERVRKISAKEKNGALWLWHPNLTFYPQGVDDDRSALAAFGMPELCLGSENDRASFTNAEIKCWFSDNCFKGLFVSATDCEQGAIFDDGVHFTSESGEAYSLLPEGEYRVTAVMYCGTEEACRAEKKVTIGRRKDQLICRFNPESHKKKMEKWAREMGFSMITDPLPGYLDAYRGWIYHMGLLKMYRANDIPLFESAAVHMFIYMIDGESTSYKTELAYLQSVSALSERMHFYHYDVGEADFCGLRGEIKEFSSDEYVLPLRVDSVSDSVRDGRLKLSGEDVISTCSANEKEIYANAEFAIAGVIKPIQMEPRDFVLQDDNTYEVRNYPDKIEYTLTAEGESVTETRSVGLVRFWDDKSDSSVLEFYNIFKVPKHRHGKTLKVQGRVIDRRGNYYPKGFEIEIKIK